MGKQEFAGGMTKAMIYEHPWCAAIEQECEQCQNVKLEREVETLSVALEPGMKDGQVPFHLVLRGRPPLLTLKRVLMQTSAIAMNPAPQRLCPPVPLYLS